MRLSATNTTPMPSYAANTPSNHSRPTHEALRWRRRIRVVSVGATVAAIAVVGSLMLTSGQESSATTPVGAAAVPVSVGSDSSPAPDMPMDMPGMDMSGTAPTPTTTMAPDMPGMDMSGTAPTPTTTMAPDMPGMDMPGDHEHATAAASHRPLAPVLGTFGGGSAAVLLSAGFLRRKDRALSLAKKAARAAGRTRV